MAVDQHSKDLAVAALRGSGGAAVDLFSVADVIAVTERAGLHISDAVIVHAHGFAKLYASEALALADATP